MGSQIPNHRLVVSWLLRTEPPWNFPKRTRNRISTFLHRTRAGTDTVPIRAFHTNCFVSSASPCSNLAKALGAAPFLRDARKCRVSCGLSTDSCTRAHLFPDHLDDRHRSGGKPSNKENGFCHQHQPSRFHKSTRGGRNEKHKNPTAAFHSSPTFRMP